MNFNLAKSAMVLVSVAVLAGCSSKAMNDTDTMDDMSSAETTETVVTGTTTALTNDAGFTAEQVQQRQDAAFAADTLFFFDLDQSTIKAEARASLQAHAAYLAANPEAVARVEGHADERGTRAYNVALGERRAEAVKRYLIVQGASSDQIGTISFGEERPLSLSQTEEGYARNRRVELVYVD